MPWPRTLLALALCCPVAAAADWPQWLGPHRDATSTEVVAPWKEAPAVVWKQPVGEGHSSPVVAGGRVFLHYKVKDRDAEEVAAWDARTGKLLWRSEYARAPFKSLFGNGPRATPAVVGDKVYTFGITGVLSCFDAASGKPVWQVDTLKKFGGKNLYFGMSGSPLVDGKRVLVNVGAKGASVVAFDRANGDVLWKSLDDAASYASPILVGEGGRRQAIFLTHDGVVSLNPEDGRLFWRYRIVDLLSESSTTPVHVGDLLLASTITTGTVALRLGEKGSEPTAAAAWQNGDLTCYFATPVPVGKDHVYMVTGTKPPAFKVTATLRCVEAKTGKELWQKPGVGEYHASLLRTGDGKLLMLEDSGTLALLAPSPKGYRELAR
ncbi:MAG TPA: PQQ-binding-like beta-propeller repeat protein, partial [Gemmataceae bacterium]|nr:PQQ-binding-like beta-propeller repeat protein [Gemmataceae bacterium]